MNNLESLPDEEINRLALDILDFTPADKYGIALPWNPTHKDSSQCQRWLFPKLSSGPSKYQVHITHGIISNDGHTFDRIVIYSGDKFILTTDCKDPNKLNRTKTICCLKVKAMEEIG